MHNPFFNSATQKVLYSDSIETSIDDNGRITEITQENKHITFHYDEICDKVDSAIVVKNSKSKVVLFKYDDQCRLSSAYDCTNKLGFKLLYNINGQIETMRCYEDQTNAKSDSLTPMHFKYNLYNKPSVIELDGKGKVVFSYNENGEVDRIESSPFRKNSKGTLKTDKKRQDTNEENIANSVMRDLQKFIDICNVASERIGTTLYRDISEYSGDK